MLIQNQFHLLFPDKATKVLSQIRFQNFYHPIFGLDIYVIRYRPWVWRTVFDNSNWPCPSWTATDFITSFILWVSCWEKTHDIFFFTITIVWFWTFFYFVELALWMLCFIIVFLNSLQEVFRVIISRETGLNCSKEIFTENPLAW